LKDTEPEHFSLLFAFSPGEISCDGERDAEGEPFKVEARSRIGTSLPKPILAKALNGARQEQDAESRN
jgi:hypothetical protein